MSLSSPKPVKFKLEYVVVVVVIVLLVVILLVIILLVIILLVVVLLLVLVIVVIVLVMEDYGLEVLAKTTGLYQVPDLGNWTPPPKKKFWMDRRTNGQTDGHTDLYYLLVVDKNHIPLLSYASELRPHTKTNILKLKLSQQ